MSERFIELEQRDVYTVKRHDAKSGAVLESHTWPLEQARVQDISADGRRMVMQTRGEEGVPGTAGIYSCDLDGGNAVWLMPPWVGHAFERDEPHIMFDGARDRYSPSACGKMAKRR